MTVCRQRAVAPIHPLDWERPYAKGMALKRQNQKRVICWDLSPSVDGTWRWGVWDVINDKGGALMNKIRAPIKRP